MVMFPCTRELSGTYSLDMPYLRFMYTSSFVSLGGLGQDAENYGWVASSIH